MDNPQQVLDSSLNRAAEITWWNRQMTKLLRVDDIKNAPEFVQHEIIERKGPYVEFVEAPKFHDTLAGEFLESLGYDQAIVQTVREELFDGEGSFYQHQAETMEAMESDSKDNILAVPTATGKTEAFFLPLLNHCLQTDEKGLKGIVIYPMKTLGVDQLNRFISYLDSINRRRDPEDRISIGIWDSDTPQRVGTRDYEIEEGAYVRGLESPRESGEKLRILSSMAVGTDNYQYSWIRVTRESIRKGVDILLTGPEALDHMFVSDNDETRGILGHDPNEHPVEHIIFDEAHIWSGIQGAAISLLAQRLKHYYSERKPQVTMVSATVDNPTELASALTRTPQSEINTIGFTGRDFSIQGEPDFSRFAPCNVDDIALTLTLAYLGNVEPERAEEDFGLGGAIKTLVEVGLVSSGDQLELLSSAGEWLSYPINQAFESQLQKGEFESESDIIQSSRSRDRLTKAVLDASATSTGWYEFVLNHVPEVAAFAEWFGKDTTGAVGFRHYEELLNLVDTTGVRTPSDTLMTVMAFGRLAGVVTEKYHYFLKPPQKVYLCSDDQLVTRNSRCPLCGDQLPEVQFCKRCHEPYLEIESEGEEGFAPIAVGTPVKDCPGCGKRPRLTDITVPTPTLLSYMLTELCRVLPSRKTLAFSDSRSSAESVADQILTTEYGLMAETLYLRELIENGGKADNFDLFSSVSNRMREEYWEPLIQNEFDEDGTAYNFLRGYLDEIVNHAKLHNCEGLFDSALVTAGPVLEAEVPEELVIRHELFKLYVTNPGIGFQQSRIKFEGLTRTKIVDRLASRTGFTASTISAHLDAALKEFLEVGVLIQQPWDEVRERVQQSSQDEDVKEELFDYLDDARADLTNRGIISTAESGLITRNIRQDRSELILLTNTAFCVECYRSYPVTNDGIAPDNCSKCGLEMDTYHRFLHDNDGNLVASPGYAEVVTGWPYAIDHWSHDITRPIRDGKDPDFITVGIHKGDTPHAVRGAIEEGFRRDDPEVNIVSATPTMELGVDIGTLESVTQVGIPPTLTNYVQRSGRTGRTRGSSSLVLTAIRGDHPVDSHYYGHLDAFLDDFEPVRVPDPMRFKEILAGHVVTETFAYLARNPHEENVFQRMYSLTESKESLQVFVNDVERRLNILRMFILEEQREAVVRHIRSIFDEEGVEAFDAVFDGDGPLSMQQRVENTFSRLVALSSTAEASKNLSETNRRLDKWLQQLGYLANYRNFGQGFPVKFSGRTEGIEFESSGRLYDMYPGEENDIGAAIKLHGTNYLVSDVRGTAQSLTTVEICENEECGRPFKGYSLGTDICPHCGQELTETPIHSISSVECKAASGGQEGYSTRGLMSSFVDSPDLTINTTETTVFGLPCELVYGERKVTDFVYAFERWHRAGTEKEVLRSQALIEVTDTEDPASQSWREQLVDVEREIYRPVGQQYFTQGLTLRFNAVNLLERFERATHNTASWTQALVSLEQAFDKAISTIIELDRDDFRVTTSFSEEFVDVHIVDSRQGGNGISWQVQDRLVEVERRVRYVPTCKRCVDYCDECLLLSRTPAHYLENNLLDRRTLAVIIGLDEGSGTAEGVTEPA